MNDSSDSWEVLIPKEANPNGSRNIYAHKQHYADWEAIKNSHAGNYYLGSIMRAAYSLNANAGGRTGRPARMERDGFVINYILDDNGDVKLLELEGGEEYQERSGRQPTGLYRVRYTEGNGWRTLNSDETKMEVSHRWKDAHYAAVAGKFDDKEQAGKKLIEHIRNAYAMAFRGHSIDVDGKHYSLFWQNGGHKSDKSRDSLVSLLQQAMGRKSRVHWLVHGEGAGTFVRALQELAVAETPKLHLAETDKKVQNRQVVYFSNPRGKGTGTDSELKELCEKVGFDYGGIQRNKHDLWDKQGREEFAKTWVVMASKIGASGAVGAFGLDTVGKALGTAATADGALKACGMLAAGIGLAWGVRNDVSGLGRSLRGVCRSTFGKGNQEWAA